MRALVNLTCGGPGRVATTAAFLATIAFVLAGDGWDLLRAAWFTFLWASAFVLMFAVLAMLGAALGLDALPPSPAPKEEPRG